MQAGWWFHKFDSVPSFAPSFLASWTGGQWTGQPVELLHGFTQDTRQLQPGQVFVALQTGKRDGHDFLPAALAAGASAALVSRANPDFELPQLVVGDPLTAFQAIAREHRRTFRGAVTGVTGSCGKTSTKNLLAQLLGGEPVVLATEGNLNNHIGVPLTLTQIEPGRHETAVIEAGIGGLGEMAPLATMIEPDYGIVTLVAPAHTAELGGLQGVAREKAVLLQYIRPSGLAVFPKQCWDFAPFQDLPQTSIVVVPEGTRISAPRAVYFGLQSTPTTSEVRIGRRRFSFRRVSRGMAQNAVLAIVLASEIGVSDEAIQRGLDGWEPAKWRGEFRKEGERTLYLDFYNANPASMADALENFLAIVPPNEPRLFVLGCMEELGPDSPRYHRELGRLLPLRPQDHAYVIGTEAAAVRTGAIESGQPAECIEVIDTLAPVTHRLQNFKGAVFIKGSRRYELEKALATNPEKSPTGGAGGASGAGGAARFAYSTSAGTRAPFSLPLTWQFPSVAVRRSSTNRNPLS